MLDERRKQPRVRMYVPVRLYQPGRAVVETLTKDLGLGGMRCLSPTLTPVGQELRIDAPLDTGHEFLSLRGRAAWFRILPESSQFDIGISFVDLPSQARRQLSAYFERAAHPARA